MAQIIFAPLVSKVIGSMKNLTIQSSQGGHTARNKPIPNRRSSISQDISKIFLLQVRTAWANLSASDLAGWNLFQQTIMSKKHPMNGRIIRGYSLFYRHNLLLLHAGGSIITSVHIYNSNFQNPSGDSYIGGGTFGFDLDNPFDETNFIPLVKVTKPLKPRITNVEHYFKVIKPTIISHFELEMYSQYLALFGRMPVAGEKVYFRIQFLHRFTPIMQSPFNQVGSF